MSGLLTGFILTKSAYDRAGQMVLEFWLSSDSGPIQLIIDTEKAVFFIRQSDQPLAMTTIAQSGLNDIDCRPLTLKTFKSEPVCAIYCQSLTSYYRLRDRFRAANIKCIEDDIRPEDRFLMERFIHAGVVVAGDVKQQPSYLTIESPVIKPAETTIHFKYWSVDIECDVSGALFSIGIVADGFQCVLMIGQAEANAAAYIHWVADERELLQQFIALVQQHDPDLFIGWNVVNFDFAILQKRADLHGTSFAVGRGGSQLKWRQLDKSDEPSYVLVPGRVILDGIDLLKAATYNFASFSLQSVAQSLLGQGKAINNAEDRLGEIIHNFHHNKQALAKYNLMDCQLVWQIFEKTQLIQFARVRSELTGLALDRVGGSVAAFTNLYLPKLHRAGFVAPNLGDNESTLTSPGGYVMNSIPGLYKNVLVLDFKSLYPSIIRSFKIDPMGMILADPNKDIPAFDGAYFSRSQHFLPDIIAKLWAARDAAKRDQNKPLSQAIKIIMNSFYGVLGSTVCRFFDPRLSGAITKRSHQILTETKQLIEQDGYQVIYGDTDSIFVAAEPSFTAQQCQSLGDRLATRINQHWQHCLQTSYQLTSFLEIEFETRYNHFFMPTIRGTDVGTKKRYAGLIGEEDSAQLVFKGLESVRTDWTELAKQFQRKLYWQVFHQQDVIATIRETVAAVKAGKKDDLLIFRKRLRKPQASYVKTVPPHVKAARKADQFLVSQGKPTKYQRKGWIEYVITVNGPEPLECIQSAIDYDFYIDKQIRAVADAILPFIGLSFDKLTADQLTLF